MLPQSTNEILRIFTDFYINNYRAVLNSYKVELEFATILTYFSGNCAMVIDIYSSNEAKTATDLCIMLECSEADLADLSQEGLHRFFQDRILMKYKGLLELNHILCSKTSNRKIIIKNTNFNDSVLNIKMEKEDIQIELNYQRIIDLHQQDADFYNTLEGICQHLIFWGK